MKRYLKWEELSMHWENVPYTWEDVAIVTEVFELLGGGLPEKNPWDEVRKKLPPKTAKRFFDIVVKVNGKTFKENREIVEKKNITIDHIQKTFNEFGKPKISIKIEKK